jgi:hypothetical protein
LGETVVSGSIATNVNWAAANGPYVVNEDLVIESGGVLAIEAGTTVRLNSGANLILNKGASLSALGKSGAPIIFTSSTDVQNGFAGPGDWGQIVFKEGASDDSSVMEWTEIRYGSGVRIEASSPTLNHVSIFNSSGPAISMDLNSSPKGNGLTASGNVINGIAVPAGDVLDSVKWQLRGIPYVVSEGEISVGNKPTINELIPSTVQAGMTTDILVSGKRLSGAEGIRFASTNVNGAIVVENSSDTAIPVKLTVSDTQPAGAIPFELQTDAGLVKYVSGVTVIPKKPFIKITNVVPGSLRRGETKDFLIEGTNLLGSRVVPFAGSGLVVSNLVASEDNASFKLAASTSAVLGNQVLMVTNPSVANDGTLNISVNPALPKIYVDPIQPSVPPDGKPHGISLRLTNNDTVEHTVVLETVDATIATVAPGSISFAPGTSQVIVHLTGLKLGTTSLRISSASLNAVAAQVYVTNLLNGAAIGPVISSAVKVSKRSGLLVGPVISAPVGVAQRALQKDGAVLSVPVGIVRPSGANNGVVISRPVEVIQQ